MKRKIDPRIPRTSKLILPTFIALKKLDGSGNNDEILNQVIADLKITDEVADIPHNDKSNLSELQYQLAWARTYLQKQGIIENPERSVWAISPNFAQADTIDDRAVLTAVNKERYEKFKMEQNSLPPKDEIASLENDEPDDLEIDEDAPPEIKNWRIRLANVLQNMNPFGFERLTQRILRSCGFTQVEVTQKTGDGGIDGYGKWKMGGIFTFNVAFQCKRYKDAHAVTAEDIRGFRGSLTTDIEKGIFVTTGAFTKAAKDESSKPGKKQIDLIDGEALIDLIAENSIGVKAVKTYEIDEEFFTKI